MKIVLVIENDETQLVEREFSQNTIRIGRDPQNCEIVFDQTAFPMVSRRHAEISFTDNKWILIDSNSSYGTYLNGNRVQASTEINQNSAIQFGTNGAKIRIKIAETIVSQRVDAPQSLAQKSTNEQSVNHRSGNAVLQSLTGNAAPFELKKDAVRLGRATDNDFIIASDDGVVSRNHAEIQRQNGDFAIVDNGSFNGTFVNEKRIASQQPQILNNGDAIQLGHGGPVFRFFAANQPQIHQNFSPSQLDQTQAPATLLGNVAFSDIKSAQKKIEPQLLMHVPFGDKTVLTIGRARENDITLDGLQISNRHAQISKNGATMTIEDLNSTNGVFLAGEKLATRRNLTQSEIAQIGPFQICLDKNFQNPAILVFDTRSKTRIDAVHVTKEVKNRSGGGTLKLLDDISLTIQPNEFVGLLGPSGAGKSTLMDALNGMRPASAGNVLINSLDLFANLDALKQSIGYVPQDDIIHRELTVYRTLYYIAKLRLSGDVSGAEIEQIISEVLDVTGLVERRDVLISQLSGGQRKRVSIAVELITKPSVIFLDEPTSGLDPATEDKIMKLFRRIAESGRTVILTTHAMENVALFDKIVVLMRGKLVFYGAPQEALKHLGATSFKELYDKLEAPIETRLKGMSGTIASKSDLKRLRENATMETAEDWRLQFCQTEQYRRNVYEPLVNLANAQDVPAKPPKRSLGIFGAIRQTLTLTNRYTEVLWRDKLNLLILLAQAPVIALLTYFVMDSDKPRDFVYFVLSLIAVWFGTSVAAREIVRENAVYSRERMVNLGLMPYIGSKLFVLGTIVALQCLLVFLPLKFLDLTGLMKMPGVFFGVPQLWVMLLTAFVGVALGLLISAFVKTSEMATSFVPLILIPQILFSGLVGVPQNIGRVASLTMPAAWCFDSMKRFSNLDTLEPEGSKKDGANNGLGLYDSIKAKNDKLIADAKSDIESYKKDAQSDSDGFKNKLDDYIDDTKAGKNPSRPTQPTMKAAPKIKDAEKVPKNLSDYVNFLHPWMGTFTNQIVLIFMFVALLIGTVIALRWKDIR